MSKPITVDRNLYLTADRKRIVEEGDPNAYHLIAAPGGLVEPDLFKQFGFVYRPKKSKPKES